MDLETTKRVTIESTVKINHQITCVQVSEDNQLLAIGSAEGYVFLFQQPLDRKLICLLLPEIGFPIHIYFSPCNTYMFVFSFDSSSGQQYRLFYYDIDQIKALSLDTHISSKWFSNTLFDPQKLAPIAQCSFPLEYSDPDNYVYKIVPILYCYQPRLIQVTWLCHGHSDVNLLQFNVKLGLLTPQPLLKTSLPGITANDLHQLQDVSLDRKSCSSIQPYMYTGYADFAGYKQTDTFDSLGALQAFQTYLIEYRAPTKDRYSFDGATHYFSTWNDVQKFETTKIVPQFTFPSYLTCQATQNQLQRLKLNWKDWDTPRKAHPYLALEQSAQTSLEDSLKLSLNYLNLLQFKDLYDPEPLYKLNGVNIELESVIHLYQQCENILYIDNEMVVSKRAVSFPHVSGENYVVKTLQQPAVAFVAGYIVLSDAAVHFDTLTYQPYSAFFPGFKEVPQNVLYYEREDEFDEIPDERYSNAVPRSVEIVAQQVQTLRGYEEGSLEDSFTL